MDAPEILIFDADCAFCRSCVVWGQRNLSNFPEAVGYQFLQPEKYGLSQEQVTKSIWLVCKEAGQTVPTGAGRAVSKILKSQPEAHWQVLGLISDLPLIRVLTNSLYFLVATNRHRLPGGSSECKLPSADSKR
ncbi:MAG: thiol-disulfide oxidoreductase DCC family protein [Micrococcales bacterium]